MFFFWSPEDFAYYVKRRTKIFKRQNYIIEIIWIENEINLEHQSKLIGISRGNQFVEIVEKYFIIIMY